MTRLIVRRKDIQIIFGVGETASKAYMRKIREQYQKPSNEHINVKELADYSKIPLSLICQVVK